MEFLENFRCYMWLKEKFCPKNEPESVESLVKRPKKAESFASMVVKMPETRDGRATLINEDLNVILSKIKDIQQHYRGCVVMDDEIIHKLYKSYGRLGKLLVLTGQILPEKDPPATNVEEKLSEIEGKVNKILQNSPKKGTKTKEKRLFDVDINLNISTEGPGSVKAVKKTDETKKIK